MRKNSGMGCYKRSDELQGSVTDTYPHLKSYCVKET